MSTRVLVPSGVLGLGFDRDALARGVGMAPDVIAIDGGSTDSGPYYLGTGTSKYAEAVASGEWRELLDARHTAGVPLLIGSAGTCGTDSQVDALLAITRAWCIERGVTLRVATIRSELDAATLLSARADGRIDPLSPDVPTGTALDAVLSACTHRVALAGAEAFMASLADGADVVIAGRATDTALIAALPLARGEAPGAAWHAAKIAECGALCSTRPASGVILVDVDGEGFTVQPLADGARCTAFTVSAHMLYENADPLVLVEPGGRLDVSDARYTETGDGSVRVTGSRWTADARYTLKLEGARALGYQCSSLVLVREQRYIARLDEWCALVRERIELDIARHLSTDDAQITLELRRIGIDATLGDLEFERGTPVEAGVLLIVTARTQALARDVARLANPTLLHQGLPDDDAMPSFAFPWSPAETERGRLYGFCLDHVLQCDAPNDFLRIDSQRLPA